MLKNIRMWLMILCMLLCLEGCASSAQTVPESSPAPSSPPVQWPQGKLNLNENGVPMLKVHVVEDEKTETIDIETYVQGVLAGEMKNDWPEEALKAQAILARTFVLKFVDEKESRYEGADISTDIEEAQAYDASAVNPRIKQAVSAVLCCLPMESCLTPGFTPIQAA